MEPVQRIAEELQRTIQAIQSDLVFIEDRYLSVQKREELLQLQILDCKLRIEETEQQLRLQARQFDGNLHLQGSLKLLERDLPGLRGMVGALLNYPENMRYWIETCLGRFIYALVFDYAEQAEKALFWLKSQNSGRAICIALDQVSPTTVQWTVDSDLRIKYLSAFVETAPDLEKVKHYLFGRAFVLGDNLYQNCLIENGAQGITDFSDAGGTLINVQTNLQIFHETQECGRRLTEDRQKLNSLNSELESYHSQNASTVSRKKAIEEITQKEERILQMMQTQMDELKKCMREIAPLKNELNTIETTPLDLDPGPLELPITANSPYSTSHPKFVTPDAIKSQPDMSTIQFPPANTISKISSEFRIVRPGKELDEPSTPKQPDERLYFPTMRILVVDDETYIRNLTRNFLEEAGFEVIESEDGQDAILKVKNSVFDLIILDVVMPRLNGWETCKILKADPSTQKIPVIILTSTSKPIDEVRSWEYGVVQFFQKPISSKIVDDIKKILGIKA